MLNVFTAVSCSKGMGALIASVFYRRVEKQTNYSNYMVFTTGALAFFTFSNTFQSVGLGLRIVWDAVD